MAKSLILCLLSLLLIGWTPKPKKINVCPPREIISFDKKDIKKAMLKWKTQNNIEESQYYQYPDYKPWSYKTR